jgi:hypothetical protein
VVAPPSPIKQRGPTLERPTNCRNMPPQYCICDVRTNVLASHQRRCIVFFVRKARYSSSEAEERKGLTSAAILNSKSTSLFSGFARAIVDIMAYVFFSLQCLWLGINAIDIERVLCQCSLMSPKTALSKMIFQLSILAFLGWAAAHSACVKLKFREPDVSLLPSESTYLAISQGNWCD